MRWLACIGLALVCISSSTLSQVPPPEAPREVSGWPGKLDGTWHWKLFDTPNGLHPTQSWHATGSAPDGDIYVAGMDHVSNSAFHRLKTQECA